MKRFILIICALVSMMLCQSALGQEASEFYEKQELPVLKISDDLEVSLDSVRNNAVCFKHNNEYYVYLDSILVTSPLSEANTYLTWTDHGKPTAVFYARANGTMSTTDNLGMSNFNCIGPKSDTLARVNIRKGNEGIYLNLRFKERVKFDEKSPLLDTVGLGFRNDTLTLRVNDTLNMFKTLKVIEPQFSVYQSLVLNVKEEIHTAATDKKDNYNDPEKSDVIEIDFASVWNKLQVGENTITVNLATLDENCKFSDVVSKSYVIVVQADDEHNFPWLWVILGGVVVLLMAFAVIFVVHGINKERLLKKLSECKTQICNFQDNASVSSDVKDQLEVFSQRVTAAINNLRSKKLLKKDDKEECETLLNEIGEYANKLGQPQTTPEPQLLSNDELLAKIKKLEDNLSKAGDEKQAALAEQKTKLDQEHEKAVNELRDQLCREHRDEMEAQRKEHENELDRQRKSYEKVVADLRTQYEDRLRTQQQEHEKAISRLHQAYQAQIEAQKTAYEKQISEISAELNSTKNKWNADRKFVIDMYKTSESCLKAMIEGIKVNADVVSPAYAEMMQMHSESVHSFESFHAQFESVMQGDLTIAQMREELGRIFTVHIDYERSWINILGRLCAYAQVDKLAPVFGFYNAYKADISSLFVQFELFANLLGFEKIRVPALFAEKFDSSTSEPNNTDLVLPAIYPEYVEILVSSMIYDLHTIGYTHEGTTRKPKVAYYV